MTLQDRIASFFACVCITCFMAFLIGSLVLMMWSPELGVLFGKITMTAAFISGTIIAALSTIFAK